MAGHPDFGRGIDHTVILQTVLSAVSIKDSFAVQQTMFEVYETLYGIYDHGQNQRNHIENQKNRGFNKTPLPYRPLASVAFFRSEDFSSVSLLEETMNIYRDLPIFDIFKMPYPEWMRLSPDIFDMTIRLAKAKLDKELKMANDADKKMKDALKSQQQGVADKLAQQKMGHRPQDPRALPPSR